MSPQGALLTFRVGDRRLAVAAADVTEVVRPPPVTRVPHAPAAVAGVTSLRGQVLPVVALDSLLDTSGESSASRRIVVLSGVPPLGLAVDEVTGLADGEAEPGALMLTDEGEARVLPLDAMLEAAFAGLTRSRGQARAVEAAAPDASVTASEVALLGFELAGQPYALPLEQSREVLALPPEIAALPRTDVAMLGVTTLRGALLPLVSTAVLLGLPPSPPGPGSRVIVAILGDALIGFVVDRLTSILRAPPEALGPVPRVLNRAAGEAQVDSMLRLPGGRLVSVLTPEHLFREASVAQILEDGRRAKAMEATTGTAAPSAVRKLLIFTLGDEAYGLPIEQVEEVAPMPDVLSRLPRAPAYVSGVMALRGAVIPVIAQRQRFGVEAAAPAGRPRIIVCRLGELVAGFAVDAVTEILEVREDQLGVAPSVAGAGAVFDRVVQLAADGRVLLVVDPQALLEKAEADLIADLVREASAAS